MGNPSRVHGKICYLLMPSKDPEVSSRFYADVFNWHIRSHDDGSLAFDDPTGQVSGMWVTDREAGQPAGLEVHIMVRDAAAIEQAIEAHGGSLVWKSGPEEQEVYGTFRDPAGNQLGYYQDAKAS